MGSQHPGASHLDTDQLAVALRSGIHRVILKQETLNQINVFPVADGDTGTNLSMSLGAALETVSQPPSEHIGQFLASVADILLDSARGNSGAIFAQFFQGMSDSAENLAQMSVQNMTEAFEQGSEYAHDALSDPREGTILSVISVFSANLRQQVSRGHNLTVGDAISTATVEANKALSRTKNQLDVLRKADVVDAGAMGFLALVEGMADFLAEGIETKEPELADYMARTEPTNTAGVERELQFRYCTECIVTGENINRRKFRERLSDLGDSLVLAGTKRKAKVHIHTNDPEQVFDLAGEFGETGSLKADDMLLQQHSTHAGAAKFAVITDSAADIPDEEMERLDIHMVPCRIQFGNRGYLDKVTITTAEFFAELASNPAAPTTSQPTPGDFRRQFQYLASHFPDVISINLTSTVSGTLQAAQSAAERTNASGTVHVINSQNASLGQGQLAIFAAECAASGMEAAATIKALHELIPVTTSFALIRDLKYAVRGGRIPASKKWIAEWLRLTPVVQTEASGKLSAKGLLRGRKNLLQKFSRYVGNRCNPDAQLHVAIGHAVCPDDAQKLQELLLNHLPNVHKISVTELGAALGAHGGPGSLVVSVQEYSQPAMPV